ncbi:MAG: 2-oxoacid:acceptor oxidoreductase family protein [Candidatus Omnitrophica bacterium]|nr:2-oxoacid:acceptor oxidoreductase family protein [Candidatus Omnitrophota bacterium]
MKTNKIDILLAGFGGQGIMMMGKLLAQAGLASRKNVTWMPSYGAEVRGGTAYSMTKISDKEIANPIVTAPDILVAMNEPSLVKYEGMLKPKGLLILNKSLINSKPKRKDLKVVSIPMTELASKLGSVRSANMVAVGVLLKRSKLFPVRIVTGALHEMLGGKEDIFLMNKKAIEKGYARA